MDTTELLERLRQAFPVVPLPAMTLRQAQLADQSMSREISQAEWEAEGTRDSGDRWPDLLDATLIECDAALSHLVDADFCYYLPAFLSFALRPKISTDFQFDRVVVAAVHAVTELSAYNRSRLKCLTDDQIEVVTEFVRWIRDTDAFHRPYCEHALQSYWETPDAKRHTLIAAP